eukprot:1176136-Prorocentrum_minimum.AAC.1
MASTPVGEVPENANAHCPGACLEPFCLEDATSPGLICPGALVSAPFGNLNGVRCDPVPRLRTFGATYGRTTNVTERSCLRILGQDVRVQKSSSCQPSTSRGPPGHAPSLTLFFNMNHSHAWYVRAGTASDQAGKADGCKGCPNAAVCATAPKGPDPDLEAIAARLSSVKHKVLVLSGKGGVGKSTFSAQLAFALAAAGKEVGLMDVDICGPSIPKMLGLEGASKGATSSCALPDAIRHTIPTPPRNQQWCLYETGEEIHQSNMGWSPVYVQDNLGVMSIGFMLQSPDDAVVWRGPRKNGLIKQFMKDVNWGDLDYLIIDTPPGNPTVYNASTFHECRNYMAW